MKKKAWYSLSKSIMQDWQPKLVCLGIAVVIWLVLKEATERGFIDQLISGTWTTTSH